jgi:hypothetical protein
MSIRFGTVSTQFNRNKILREPKSDVQNRNQKKIESHTLKEPTITHQNKSRIELPGLHRKAKGDIIPRGINPIETQINPSDLLKKDKKFIQLTASTSQVQKDLKELVNTIFSNNSLDILFFTDERIDNMFQTLILPNFQNKDQIYIINERFDLQIESIPKCKFLFVDCSKNLNLILREVVMKCKGLVILHIPNSLQNNAFYAFKKGNPENSFYLEGDYTLIDGRKNLCFDYPSISDEFNKVENTKIIPIKSVIQTLF